MPNSEEQLEVSALEAPVAAKRKRTRVVKKDAVYTVSGLEGENLDTKATRKTAKKKIKEAASKTLFDENFQSEGPAVEQDDPTTEAEELTAEETAAEEPIPEETTAEDTEAPEERAEDTPQNDLPEDTGVEEDAEEETAAEAPAPTEPEKKSNGKRGGKRPIAVSQDFIIIEDILTDSECLLIAEKEAEQNHERRRSAAGRASEALGAEAPVVQSAECRVQSNSAQPNPALCTLHSAPAKEEPAKPVFNFDNLISAKGVIEVLPDGYGFLRSSEYDYVSSPDDVYIAVQFVKQYCLKTGDVLECKVRPPFDGEKFFSLTSIEHINGRKPEEVRDRTPFEHLTPLFPDEKFNICGNAKTTNKSTRIVDLFAPIGKGQRALIVAQPKTGKTILLKDIANAIAANHPEAYLMMLLIDERPEEVTDMARTVKAEVIASTFDEPAEKHVTIAGLVLEKAKRMVECGHDVVIFLDSITRLARAYNTVAPASGKILTGGVDANALQKPKRFFGAARNIEGGGSLTIIATALIDTGSKMDEVIFEEFKGTGNMELQLERPLSNKRIFPAVNLVASSTRRDDLLLDKYTQEKMLLVRDYIADMNPIEAMSQVQKLLDRTRDHAEFFMAINS